jgi:hypothetical protein
MRIRSRAALAAATVAALSVGLAAPAGAQEAPTLGFEIDPTEGSPGDTVDGQVDVGDVAENCAMTAEEISARFAELGLALQEIYPDYAPGEGDETQSIEYLGAQFIGLVAFGIETNLVPDETAPPGTPGAADITLAQTFIMTFADIATQAPVGERVNFDPEVGSATVTVPDVDPGLWAVAAACVTPSLDDATIRQAITAAADFLERELELGDQVPLDWQFPGGFEAGLAFLLESAPTLLEPLMVPHALGFQIFCVHDASGVCPGDEPPPPGPGPSEPPVPGPSAPPAPGPDAPPVAPPARPVPATPNYTG